MPKEVAEASKKAQDLSSVTSSSKLAQESSFQINYLEDANWENNKSYQEVNEVSRE